MARLRKALRRRARGQAVVELAVAMLVIVPTFLYVIFLDDLLKAKLDLQEAVVTAPWEYARVNFEQGSADTGLRSAIRLGWCDHTTAFNSYDRAYDCSESVHHVALAAHTCWLTNGSKQVSCSVDKSVGQLTGFPIGGVPIANDQFTRGGLVRCSARLGVINYSLPQKLFQEFTQVKMTRTTQKSGDVHAAGQGLAVEAQYLLEEQQAGLVVDSWALADPMQRITSTGSGTLRSRTNAIYMPYAIAAAALGGLNFATKVLASDLLNATIFLDGIGDNPLDANVAFDPDFENGTFNSGDFHASPRGPKRGDKYMGQSSAP
jgi:hypothetical protein